MRFKPTEADPCIYTRDDNKQTWIVSLFLDDMLIASRDKDVIIPVKAQIVEKSKIKDLDKLDSFSAPKSIIIWTTGHLEFESGFIQRLLPRSSDKKIQIPV
ncbi:unnamed protein product [Phytophthora fragariaefolia]|uniref:Unnamed protein product n=1 Tax=Phytophthora fragariaefolia TaxID=1490495 RepID=A0A9W6WNF7_9STRA|nr:unnamed protein product [Phytophthora fragariaefolia]